MSIEKLVITKEVAPFTTLPNKVLQHLKDAEALGLWCYLASLPPIWNVRKDKIREHFAIGINKLDNLFKILQDCNLMNIKAVRKSNGHFAHWDIVVRNGDDFAHMKERIENKDLNSDAHQSYENHANGNHANGKQPPINKIYINKKEKQKSNISCASKNNAPVNDDSSFENFWRIYPRKKDKARAKKIWDKKRYSEHEMLILSDVQKRTQIDHQWQDIKFIPHPSTYLNNELWNDDITPKTSGKGRPNNNFDEVLGGLDEKNGRTFDESGNRVYSAH